MSNELYKQLKGFGRVKANAALAKYSSFKIGGPAEFLVEVDDREKLVGLLNFLSGEGIEWMILGGGSNVLLPDEGFAGVAIKILHAQFKIQDATIEADAGMDLSQFVTLSIQHGLSGFEWAAGIPGSVGGAIRGNAGAHYAFAGGEIKDSIETVVIWRDGEVVELPNIECRFGYRDSVFKHSTDIILAGRFQLAPGNQQESLVTTQKIIAERRGKQSKEPSARSFFKNVQLEKWTKDTGLLPERFLKYKKIAAGWLVEQVGLKGFRVGNAMVSNEHGNFIINLGGATQADVLRVVEEVKSRVYDTFEVELEEEVQIIH